MKILLTVDRSSESQKAVDLLQRIQFPKQSSLYLLHVVEPQTWAEGIEDKSMIHLRSILAAAKSKEVHKARTFLHKVADSFKKSKMKVTPLVKDGIAGSEILSAIDKYRIDLTVLGTRGRSGLKRFFLGSVSEWVLSESPCSVLIVRRTKGLSGKTPKRLNILIGTDGSSDANAAMEFFHRLKFPSSSHATICHVLEEQGPLQTELSARLGVTGSSNLKELSAEIRKIREDEGQALLRRSVPIVKRRGLTVETLLVHGDPSENLLAVSQRKNTDVLVVGSRGITGLRRIFLGSVSQRLVQHSPSSVLVVREPGGCN